jgi:MoaD family protein
MATVKLYATLRKAAGEREFESRGATVKAVLEESKQRFGPDFTRHLASCTVLVNGRNAALLKGKRTPVADGDVVAIFPPMAGG